MQILLVKLAQQKHWLQISQCSARWFNTASQTSLFWAIRQPELKHLGCSLHWIKQRMYYLLLEYSRGARMQQGLPGDTQGSHKIRLSADLPQTFRTWEMLRRRRTTLQWIAALSPSSCIEFTDARTKEFRLYRLKLLRSFTCSNKLATTFAQLLYPAPPPLTLGMWAVVTDWLL